MTTNLWHIEGSWCQGEGAIFSALRCAELASVLRNVTCDPSKDKKMRGRNQLKVWAEIM